MRAPFPYVESGRTDAEMWYAVGDQLARQSTQTKGEIYLHVHTCVPLFRISGTAGCIVLTFALRVERLTSYACYTNHERGSIYERADVSTPFRI